VGEKLEAAKNSVEHELQQARLESQKLIEEARAEGLKNGASQAEQYKTKLGKLKDLYASEMSHDLLRNSLEAAQQLVRTELDSSPEALLKFVQEALNTVPEALDIRIRANPKDTVILRQNKERLINLLQRAKDIDIREDKQVAEGIILQTESGVIDAQLKTQVEEITRLLGL
jgi:type III secretion protein L